MIQRRMVGKCNRPFQKGRSYNCMLNAVIHLIWASRNTTECLIPEVLLDTMCVKCLYKATTKTSWHEPAFSLVSSSFSTSCRPGRRGKNISYPMSVTRSRKKGREILVRSLNPKTIPKTTCFACQEAVPIELGPAVVVIFVASKPRCPRPTLPGSGAWFDREAQKRPGWGQFGGSWLSNYFAGGLDQNAWSCFNLFHICKTWWKGV